jgi:hypothetical protein
VTQPLAELIGPWLAWRVELLSPGPVALASPGSPGEAVRIADPDGHALRVRRVGGGENR